MTPEEANRLNLERVKDNGNQPSFPIDQVSPFHRGLTKREYIAARLMASAITNGMDIELAADEAVKGVDLLLIKLNKNA